MKTREQAIKDLLTVLPHLRLAVEEASESLGDDGKAGVVGLAVGCFFPNRTGRITARIEAPEFVEDLAIALGAGPSTEEEKLEAKAQRLLDTMSRSYREA